MLCLYPPFCPLPPILSPRSQCRRTRAFPSCWFLSFVASGKKHVGTKGRSTLGTTGASQLVTTTTAHTNTPTPPLRPVSDFECHVWWTLYRSDTGKPRYGLHKYGSAMTDETDVRRVAGGVCEAKCNGDGSRDRARPCVGVCVC